MHAARRSAARPRAALSLLRAWRTSLLALAILGVPWLLTWPLALHLAERFPGDQPTDAMIHTRQLWWVQQALGSLRNPYFSPVMLYPEGAWLFLETLVPIDGALAWVPAALFGPIAAYNLVVLAMLGASGLAAWALAAQVSGDRAAGAVAGVIYVASPYLMNHVRTGHLGVISAVWIPLALLALLEAVRTRRARWVALGGIALAAAAYTDLQAALSLALLAALLGLAEAFTRPRRAPRTLAAIAASGALGLLLAAPLLAGVVGELRSEQDVHPPIEHAERNSADLLAFASPQPLHPLWGAALRDWYRTHGLDREDESVVYPGLVVVGLAIAGLASRETRRPFWALAALLLALLSLGPTLHAGGLDQRVALPLDLPTPYALLQQVPLVSVGRTPARFMGPAMLCLAVLAASGVVAARRRAGSGAPWVPALAALLALFEFLPAPYPLSVAHVPSGYRLLAETGCSGPILELPVDAGSPDQKARLFFQTLHGCPISGGYRSRGGDETALTAEWRRVARREEPESSRAQRLRDQVNALGFHHLVIWKPVYESSDERERDLRLVRALFPGPPLFEDDETIVYNLPAARPREGARPWAEVRDERERVSPPRPTRLGRISRAPG